MSLAGEAKTTLCFLNGGNFTQEIGNKGLGAVTEQKRGRLSWSFEEGTPPLGLGAQREHAVTQAHDCRAAGAATLEPAAGAGTQEPSLAPVTAAAATTVAFVTAVTVSVALAAAATRPFIYFPVSSQ